MRCSSAPSLRRLLAFALVSVLAAACVSRGKYQAVVEERDALRERAVTLERSNTSLSAERVRLMDDLEDLRQEREALSSDVEKLERARNQLVENLTQTEAQLAARQREIAQMRSTYDGLVSDLESQVASGQIQIEQLKEGLRLNLSQEILFPLGSARLNAEGEAVIATVARRLADLRHRVEVQGHTDDLPIGGALARRYPSNWELAAARATEVVRLLARHGVAEGRLTAVSYGEFEPVAPNTTPEGRARNRRIEIRLLPVGGPLVAAPEPVLDGGE